MLSCREHGVRFDQSRIEISIGWAKLAERQLFHNGDMSKHLSKDKGKERERGRKEKGEKLFNLLDNY